jgi:hypothetical protein
MLVGALAGCMLVACASDTTTKAPELYGWRSAGLVLRDADRTGGLHKMVNIGNTLFVMDAYAPDSAPKNRPYQWRIWKGDANTGAWSQLSMPQGQVPTNSWVVKGQELVVGMKYTGQVWCYSIVTGRWRRLSLPPLPESPDTLWELRSLGLYSGRLVVGVTTYGAAVHYTWLEGIGADTAGEIIPGIGAKKNWPLDYVQEFEGALYGISSQYGVFRWTPGADSWEQLPSPRGRTNADEDELVSAIGIHAGRLYVGYARNWDGIYRWNGDGTWTSVTPKPDDGRNIRETPRDVRVLTSYRGRLYMAGVAGSSVIMWAPKDTAKPTFGDWRLIDNGWCNIPDYGCGSQNWGIVGIGDTLYSTGWGFVAKCPIADFEKMSRPLYKQP